MPCQLLKLKELEPPDGCAEVFAFAKQQLTSLEQWTFFEHWIVCSVIRGEEIPSPDGCAEVIGFAKHRLTTREQWDFIRLACQVCEWQIGGAA